MGQILFIDDDTDALETYKKAVALGSHQAILASNGDQAWERISNEDIDLIFVDLNLPDISGIELIRNLKDEPHTASIPVVVLSALPQKGLIEKVLNAGAKNFISKPAALNELLSVIEENVSS